MGDYARGLHVAVEDAAIAGKRHHSFLDACACTVVEADDRRANFEREIHELVNLLGKHFAKRAAEDGEVLAEHEHLAPVDGAPARDHTVGIWPLFKPGGMCTVAGEEVEFVKAVGVEQCVQALAGEHLALFVLALHRTW